MKLTNKEKEEIPTVSSFSKRVDSVRLQLLVCSSDVIEM